VARKRNRKPEKLEDIIKTFIGKLDASPRSTSEEMAGVWKRACGGTLAAHSKPSSLRKKKLAVNVENPGWLYEFSLKKGEILKRLKEELGPDKVDQIQFRIGEI